MQVAAMDRPGQFLPKDVYYYEPSCCSTSSIDTGSFRDDRASISSTRRSSLHETMPSVCGRGRTGVWNPQPAYGRPTTEGSSRSLSSPPSFGPPETYLQLVIAQQHEEEEVESDDAPPPSSLPEMGYPQDPQQDDQSKQTLSFREVPRRRRISMHARIESWQHQLGSKILDSVIYQPALVCDSSGSTSSDELDCAELEGTACSMHQSTEVHQEPKNTFASSPGGTGTNVANRSADPYRSASASPTNHDSDFRWLYSKTVWPISTPVSKESRILSILNKEPTSKNGDDAPSRVTKNTHTPSPKIIIDWDAFTLMTVEPPSLDETDTRSDEDILWFLDEDLD